MKISDIMTLGAATVRHDASLLNAIETMVDHRISALPVIDDKGLLCGILTEGDIIRAVNLLPADTFELPEAARRKLLSRHAVAKFMTAKAITLGPDAGLKEALALMEQSNLKRLPVAVNSRVLGLLSRADILSAFVA